MAVTRPNNNNKYKMTTALLKSYVCKILEIASLFPIKAREFSPKCREVNFEVDCGQSYLTKKLFNEYKYFIITFM